MNDQEINKLLSLLNADNLTGIRQYLVDQKEKNELEKETHLSAQSVFERYIAKPNPMGFGIMCKYAILENGIMFSNCTSLYVINYIFDLNVKINRLKNAGLSHRLISAHESLTADIIGKAEYLLGTPVFCRRECDIVEEKNVIFSRGCFTPKIKISKKELLYASKFLGENLQITISKDNPLIFVESDKGKAYILGKNY